MKFFGRSSGPSTALRSGLWATWSQFGSTNSPAGLEQNTWVYSSICQREQRATCSLVGHPRVDLSDRSSSSEGPRPASCWKFASSLCGEGSERRNCNSVSAEGSELRMVWANLPSKDFMVSAQPEDPLGFWAFVYFGAPLAAVRLLLTPADTQN